MTYLSTPLLFMPVGQRKAAAAIVEAVASASALATLVGVDGSGKTTVLRRIAAELGNRRVRVIEVNDTPSGGLGLAGLVAQIGRQANPTASQDEERERAFEALTALDDDVERIALLVDDAQRLEPSALRYIQLACRSSPMLRVVLARSLNAPSPLDDEEFATLRERIARRVELAPLSDDEASAFATHLLHAGGVPTRRALLPQALDALVRHGEGNPRRIGLLLRRALALAVARSEAPMQAETVEEAVAALNGASPSPPPPARNVKQVEKAPGPARRQRGIGWALAGFGIGASLALATVVIGSLDSSVVTVVPSPIVTPAPASVIAPIVAAPAPATAPGLVAPLAPDPAPLHADVEASMAPSAASPATTATSSATPPSLPEPSPEPPLEPPSAALTMDLPLPPPLPQVEAPKPAPEPNRASRAVRTASERTTSELRSAEQRCRDIVIKAQLGDDISHDDQQFLRAGCRSGR